MTGTDDRLYEIARGSLAWFADVKWLCEQLRDARAEIERLSKQMTGTVSMLAAERAKVERVEAVCESGVFDVREWGERGTPFSNGADRAFGRIRAALAGGEQGE